MTEYATMTMPTAVRDDFVDFGWDKLVAALPAEKPGMRDAFNAVEFAMPKGAGSVTVRLHPKLPSLLRLMLEVRWADHMDRMTELEAPYARVLAQLKKIANQKPR